MANVFLIVGEDDYLVTETAKKRLGDRVGLEEVDSVGATSADLQLGDLRRVEESVMTPPFFDPSKVTWWRNVDFLPQQGGKRAPSAEVTAALEAFAGRLARAGLPDNQRLVISGRRWKPDSPFAAAMKGFAEVVEFKTGKPWERSRQAVEWVGELAAEAGLAFEGDVASRFVARVGFDSRSLMNELGKLRDYLGERKTVSARDVEAVSSPGPGVEPAVWDVTDAVGERNAAKAVTEIRKFEGRAGFEIQVVGALERFFRQLTEYLDAMAKGRSPEGLSSFQARKFAGFAKKWGLREAREARARFIRLRERCVSESVSVDALLYPEVVRTCTR